MRWQANTQIKRSCYDGSSQWCFDDHGGHRAVPDRASYLQTLLKRIEPAANICVDRVKSVLSSYASGSAPNRDILLEAGNEWRQNMAMLRDMRNGTDAPSEVDAGERPRA